MNPTLLIASPQLKDPFFQRTVVLLWHHDADGAIGVVINRPLAHALSEVIDLDRSLDLSMYEDGLVSWGGPVEAGTGTVIAGVGLEEEDAWILPDNMSVTRSQEVLVRLVRRRVPLVLCLGYAGWGPNQLDQEFEAGGWLSTDMTRELVFDTPPEERYDRALATLGLTANTVWMTPINE